MYPTSANSCDVVHGWRNQKKFLLLLFKNQTKATSFRMSGRIPIAALRRQKQDVGGVTIGSNELNNRRIDTILQQACVSGTLRIANRNLTELPREIFFLHEMSYDSKRWWEEQQLTVLDISHNLLEKIDVPSSSTSSSASANGQARVSSGARTGTFERRDTASDNNAQQQQQHPLQAFQRLRLIVASTTN